MGGEIKETCRRCGQLVAVSFNRLVDHFRTINLSDGREIDVRCKGSGWAPHAIKEDKWIE